MIRLIILIISFMGVMFLLKHLPPVELFFNEKAAVSGGTFDLNERDRYEWDILKSSFPEISSKSYIVWDLEGGQIISENNAGARLPIASLTKLMTALLVFEESDLRESVLIPKESLGKLDESGNLSSGEKLSVGDLLHAALLASSNDATEALAMHVGGKVFDSILTDQDPSYQEKVLTFVLMMNLKARKLGMTNTVFQTPTGLDHADQYSSAQDLKLLVDALSHFYPEALEITSKSLFSTHLDNGKIYVWKNSNELLQSFSNIKGGKTGFTLEARGALFTVWEAGDKSKIASIILGAEDRFGEMQ